jgi:hypothetical protein
MLLGHTKSLVAALSVVALVASCGSTGASGPSSHVDATAVSSTREQAPTSGKPSAGPIKRAATSPKYRPARPPLVTLDRVSSGGPAFTVRIRFNRRLPQDRQGPQANFLVGSSGSDAPPQWYGIRSRYCYAGAVGNDIHGGDPGLKDVKVGSTVKLSIRVRGQRQIVENITLREGTGTALKALGCVRHQPR